MKTREEEGDSGNDGSESLQTALWAVAFVSHILC